VKKHEWWVGGSAAVAQLTERDPQAAVELWKRATDKEVRNHLFHYIAMEWVKKAPEATLSWALTMPEEDTRMKLAGNVLEYAARKEPAKALTLLDRLENSSARGETGWNILWPWALRAPEQAFAEMTKNGGAWPDRLAYGLGDAMARYDATRASEAARDMPEGPKRDQFVQGVLIGVAYTDPGAAVGVMDLISDEELTSHGGLNSFIGAWARKDAPAAAQWIAGLPDDASHKKDFAASHFQTETGCSWQDVLKKGGAK